MAGRFLNSNRRESEIERNEPLDDHVREVIVADKGKRRCICTAYFDKTTSRLRTCLSVIPADVFRARDVRPEVRTVRPRKNAAINRNVRRRPLV